MWPGPARTAYNCVMVPSLRVAVKAAAFLAAYLFTCVLLHGDLVFSEAVLWMPTGVAIAGLWLMGWRYWPLVLLGTLLHRLWAGYSFPTYLPSTIGNTLEALTAVLIMRGMGFRQDFRRLRDGLILLLVAFAGPAVGATIGRTTYMGHIGELSFFEGWAGWWRMNALGVLVIVPLVLSWAGKPSPRPRLGAVLEALGLCGLVIAVIWTLATIDPARREVGMVLAYLALPVALYAALRFGVRGAATASAAVAILLTLGTSHGLGPFLTSQPQPGAGAAHENALQAVIAIITATPLLLGAAIAEREAALARAAAERTRHREFLSSIDQNVREGLFRIGPDYRLAYVNVAFARMLGHDAPEELLGRPFTSLLAAPGNIPRIREALRKRGHVTAEEERLLRKDGTVLLALLSCTAVRGPDGTIAHYDGAASDLTSYKQLEDQLRQTQKMEALGKLAGGVAHDFNNLLTVISGHAELLKESLDGSAGGTHADEIRAAAIRASRLTGQLLAYSRRQVLTPEVLDLRNIVDQSGGMLRRLIGEDVELAVEHPAEELPVRVDRGQIEQVILNLVLNARDAMPGGGRIVLSTSRFGADGTTGDGRVPADLPAGSLVHLGVRDTGVGMTAEVMRLAFAPFFTTKETGRGTGLGLSTVYGIVRQSGGAVWLESAPGAGTTARVCLPLATKESAQPAPPRPAPAPKPAHGTILVVEDEPALRELLAVTLSRDGCTVLVAEDGQAALEAAQRATAPLDLVVTDVVMPRMGGRDLVTRLAAGRPGLRVLMISGYAWGPPEWTPPEGTTVAYLQKPFAPSTLLEHVRACLATPAPPQA